MASRTAIVEVPDGAGARYRAGAPRPARDPHRRPGLEGGTRGEAEVLSSCYRRCLEVADSIGAKSVTFPAISTGIYGYPPKAAARVAIATLTSTPTRVERIRLVCFDQPSRGILTAALADVTGPARLTAG